jgi:hypothetical protein
VEGVLQLTNTLSAYQSEFQIKLSSGFDTTYYTQIAISLTKNKAGFTNFLEIWTNVKAIPGWRKAFEFGYEDSNDGTIIISPYYFNSVLYNNGSFHKILYHHTTTRSMTVESQHSPPSPQLVVKSKATVTQVGSDVNVYCTVHLDINLNLIGNKDAWLLGAIIGVNSPYNAYAKQGIRDIGSTYDFTLYGIPHGLNCGVFSNGDFVNDGQSGTPGDAIDPANLPTSAEVEGIDISWYVPGDTPPF